jgi:hypothetical protein
VFDRIAPWPLFILAALVLARRGARQLFGSEQWLLVWCCALTPVLLFTIVRTHHSWYIVPAYAAWALLGAASVVDLYRGFHLNEGGRLLVGAAAVIGLLGCEARIVLQMIVHSRSTDAELFLESLGSRDLPRGTRLDVAFIPSYSERFILQVVDGYALNEVPSSTVDRDGAGAHHRLLIRRLPGSSPALATGTQVSTLVAQSQTYALAERTTAANRQ